MGSISCSELKAACECDVFIAPQARQEALLVKDDDILTQDERDVELYLKVKQESLGLQFLPAERLRVTWTSVKQMFSHFASIRASELGFYLSNMKLLGGKYEADARWRNFYRHFKVMQETIPVFGESDEVERYDFLTILSALIYLSHEESTFKSLSICEYFTNKQIIMKRRVDSLNDKYMPIATDPPSPSGGRRDIHLSKAESFEKNLGENSNHYLDYQMKLKSTFLSREAIQKIVSIVVQLSLTLVPLYASNCVLADQKFYSYVTKLHKVKDTLTQQIIDRFEGPRHLRCVSGSVSVYRFVIQAKEMDLYNTSEIRKMAYKLAQTDSSELRTASELQDQSLQQLDQQGYSKNRLNDSQELFAPKDFYTEETLLFEETADALMTEEDLEAIAYLYRQEQKLLTREEV